MRASARTDLRVGVWRIVSYGNQALSATLVRDMSIFGGDARGTAPPGALLLGASGKPTRAPKRVPVEKPVRHNTLANRCARALGRMSAAPEQAQRALMSVLPELSWYTHEGGGAFEDDGGADAPLLNDEALYRAISALLALYSLLENDVALVTRSNESRAPMSKGEYDEMHASFVKRCDLVSIESDEKDAIYYLVAVLGVGRSVPFKSLVNSFLDESAKTDNSLLVMGHALRIASDITLNGYAQLNAALPTFKSISGDQKVQMMAALATGFRLGQPLAGASAARWLPRAACGEVSLKEMRGLFSSSKAGMKAAGLARYMYASTFHVAGESGTRAQLTPNVTKKLYAEYDAFIKLIIDHVYPKEGPDVSEHEDPGMSLYRSVMRTYASAFGASSDALREISEQDDVSFVASRLFAASKYAFSDVKLLKTLLEKEGGDSVLVKELCGKAAEREISLAHMHSMVMRCCFSDAEGKTRLTHNVETEGYVGLLDSLKAALAAARAYAEAEAHTNAGDTLDVSVSGLAAILRSRALAYEQYKRGGKKWTAEHVEAYEGGKTLAEVVEAHVVELKRLNASCTELYLAPKRDE